MRENTYKMNIAYDKVSAKILKMSGDHFDKSLFYIILTAVSYN